MALCHQWVEGIRRREAASRRPRRQRPRHRRRWRYRLIMEEQDLIKGPMEGR